MPSLSPASPRPPDPVLSGMALDRVSTQRKDSDWLADRLADPGSVLVAATHDGVLIDSERSGRLRRVPVADAAGELDRSTAILLGVEHGTAVFAIDLEALDAEVRERVTGADRLLALREAGAMLSHAEGGLAAYVVAVLNWHRTHGFCANCGEATTITEAGGARHCPRCGANHFPRTDPAVIMLVAHGERVLLGRRPIWPEGRYSVLAGFVAPGESLEEAVIREVQEESGIDCFDPRFVASQPWPFPASLMLGFQANSDGGEPRTLDGELEDVRWFTREQIRGALAGDDSVLQLPPSVSIAYLLLEHWAGGEAG
jgi:NAD+ diphosphatase